MTVEIKHRFTHEVICSGESVRAAVLANYKNLGGADLRYADLHCADLHCADLHCADLRYANLRGAGLRGVDLGRADLRDADLGDADLRGADLRYADLGDADLHENSTRLKVAWQSHDLLAAILRRAAGDDIAKLKIAGFVLICRGECWDYFTKKAARDPFGDWALDTLAEWVQEGDDAPEFLRERQAAMRR